MKSILKVFYSALIIFLIPFSLVCGQEKKSEQKIRIVVDDGSGTKVVIDTLIKDGEMKDSIKLKDGKVMVFRNSKGKATKHGEGYRVITRSSEGGGDNESTIYITENDRSDKEMGEKIDVFVDRDDKKSDSEKTKYVIKKNGMVVSVEGSDYEKVKELVKVIENNLEVKQSTDSKSENKKDDNKNTGKKK